MNGDSLDEAFQEAATWLKSQKNLNLPQDQLLKVYALYKQSTIGQCTNDQKPSLFDFTGRAKWSAWKDLGELSKEESKEAYIKFVNGLVEKADKDPSVLTSKGDNGTSSALSFKVSTMASEREQISDGEKTVFQWAEEGNVERVLAGVSESTVNQRDDMGMSLLHWAADRNHLSMARELLSRKADPNLENEDGETPLYLACMAEHRDTAHLLLENGADLDLIDFSEEPEMKDWLQVQGLFP